MERERREMEERSNWRQQREERMTRKERRGGQQAF